MVKTLLTNVFIVTVLKNADLIIQSTGKICCSEMSGFFARAVETHLKCKWSTYVNVMSKTSALGGFSYSSYVAANKVAYCKPEDRAVYALGGLAGVGITTFGCALLGPYQPILDPVFCGTMGLLDYKYGLGTLKHYDFFNGAVKVELTTDFMKIE